MNRDVFLSLLALDSYNRGPGRLVFANGSEVESAEVGAQIGNATILNAELPSGSLEAGFYAVAYEWNNNGIDETVISYRGTNFPSGTSAEQILSFASDLWGGWNFFLGFSRPSQADFAKAFYKEVTSLKFRGEPGFVDPFDTDANIILTGHSLGGALAGYVGARADAVATVFDPIPFGDVATTDALSAALARTVAELLPDVGPGDIPVLLANLADPLDLFPDSQITVEQFAVRLAQNITAALPRFSNVDGRFLEGEIANQIPLLQTQLGSLLGGPISTLLGVAFGPFVGALTSALGGQQAFQGLVNASFSDRDGVEVVDNRGLPDQTLLQFSLDSVALHSMSWLTLMLFGEKQWAPSAEQGGEDRGSDWEQGIRYIIPATADDGIGAALGRDLTTGTTSAGAQLSNIIAYSVLNEGTLVFGDTGARALFDDAGDLGIALPDLPTTINEDVRSSIGKVVAEFAGLLAVNKLTQTQWSAATAGVLSIKDEGLSLSVDLRKDTWSLNGILPEAYQISTGQGLAVSILKSALGNADYSEAKRQSVIDNLDLWSALDSIDSVAISLAQGAGFSSLSGSDTPLLVTSSGADNIVVRQDRAIVVTGDGANTFSTTGTAIAFMGGRDNDNFTGGTGNDWFFGGRGTNIINGNEGFDIAVYVDSGTTNLVYTGNDITGSLNVFGNGYNDTVTGIERIVVDSATPVFRLVGYIGADTNLVIASKSGNQITQGQTIDVRSAYSGQVIYLNRNGYASQMIDKVTGGAISFENFNTTVFGSDYDDEISDGSSEEKLIVAGDGDDIVDVSETIAAARLEGGEGSDILLGGDANDVIIDEQAAPSSGIYIQPGGWWTPMRPVIGSIEAGAGDDQIVIDIGGVPGLTFGGDEYGYGPGPELPSGNDNGLNYFLKPGQGNDVTDINFNGQLEYKYDRGDGIDQIRLQSAGTFGLSTNPNEFPLSTLEMTALSVDASAYSRAEADISFSETSRQLVMIDPPGGDNADLYVIKGSVTIAFSDGGSITIDNVYGVVAEDWRFADENEFNVYNARFPFQIRFSDEEVNQIGIAGSAYGRSGASSSIAPLNEPTDFVYGGSERLSSPTALGGMRERTLHDTFEVPLMGAAGWPASIHDALKAPMEDDVFAAVARYDGDQSARRLHLDPSQHELAGGPALAVLDLQSYLTSSEPAAFGSQAPVGRESVVAQSLESYLGFSSDTDVVRKLAIIRQDMSTFGVTSGPESERLRPDMPESIYFYA